MKRKLSRVFRRRLAPITLAAVICLSLTGGATPAASQPDASPHTYRIEGVTTREQRSAITATGAAIERVEDDAVEIIATPGEVK